MTRAYKKTSNRIFIEMPTGMIADVIDFILSVKIAGQAYNTS